MSIREALALSGPPLFHPRPQGGDPARIATGMFVGSSLNRALAVIGDRWALRILGDSFAGVRRFEEFQARSGAARSTLASRLGCLVACGIFDRVRYSQTPPRSEYRLSAKGAELYGFMLLCWGLERAWTPGRVAAASYRPHESCGHALKPALVCGDCGGQVTFHNTDYKIVPAGVAGARPKPNFRRLSSATSADPDAAAGKAFADLTDIIGDRWTLLVVCAGFLGLRRFDAIQSTLHIASNILTHRLNRLVASGLIRRRLYSQHPPRCEYRLTQKGLALFPVVVALTQWGDRWLAPRSRGNLLLFHQECGWRLHAIVTCAHCSATVEPADVGAALTQSN